jgi:hypothetical protein
METFCILRGRMGLRLKAAKRTQVKFVFIVALLLGALLLPPLAITEEYNGRVVAITASNRLTLLVDGNQ